jgi:hypothetical protein
MSSKYRKHFIALWLIPTLTSTILGWEMMDRVNSRLPEADRFQPLGWYWIKSRRLRREYKSLYPEGSLLKRERLLFAVSVSGLVLAAWGFVDL